MAISVRRELGFVANSVRTEFGALPQALAQGAVHGERCVLAAGAAARRVEFHHMVPWARRGDRSPANIRLMCRTHNAYLATKDYGEAVMARFRRIHRAAQPPTEGRRGS